MWKLTPDSTVVELTPSVGGAAADIVWVPSERLSFTDCQMPPARKMLRQMVSFALEDRMLEPIEKLHFALGEPSEDTIPVIVVSHQQMDEWRESLDSKEITARMFLPDIYAIPYEEGRVSIWHEGDRCLLRNGTHSGFVGSLEWISVIAGLESYTNRLDIYSDHIESLPEEWRTVARPLLAPLEQVMERFDGKDTIDLLQGDYRTVNPVVTWLQPWRAAAAIALVALVAHIGNMVFDIRLLDAQTAELESATAKLFKTIDTSGNLRNLRVQVSRQMKNLQEHKSKSEDSAWQIMTKLDRALSGCGSCRVEALELGTDTASIKLRSEGDLEKVKDILLNIQSLEANHKVLREGKDYSLSRFEFKVAS